VAVIYAAASPLATATFETEALRREDWDASGSALLGGQRFLAVRDTGGIGRVAAGTASDRYLPGGVVEHACMSTATTLPRHPSRLQGGCAAKD
jgi:hypothetical protein